MISEPPFIKEPIKHTTVIDEVDLVVVGGSCTGVFAALRAASHGLSVAIIETTSAFGGMATNGRVPEWHSTWNTNGTERVINGYTMTVTDELVKRGAAQLRNPTGAAPDGRTEWDICSAGLTVLLDELIINQPRITPYLESRCVAVQQYEQRISHVIIENVSGRQAIACSYVIDASGNGALIRAAQRAGAATELWRGDQLQPASLQAVISGMEAARDIIGRDQPGGGDPWSQIESQMIASGYPASPPWLPVPASDPSLTALMGARHQGVDASDAKQYTAALMRARMETLRYCELTTALTQQPVRPVAWAASLGVRETGIRPVWSRVTAEDLLSGHQFDDAIAWASIPSMCIMRMAASYDI